MNTFNVINGGNPTYNQDLLYVQDSMLSGFTNIINTMIKSDTIGGNIILWGINPIVISASTVSAYYQWEDGAIYVEGDVYPVKAGTLACPSHDLTIGLYFTPVTIDEGLTVYKNLDVNYNYKTSAVSVTDSGDYLYSYTYYTQFKDAIKEPNFDKEVITLDESTSSTKDYYIDTMTNYVYVNGTPRATININLPVSTMKNLSRNIKIKLNFIYEGAFAFVINIKNSSGTVLYTVSNGVVPSGTFLGYLTFYSNGTTYELQEQEIAGDKNLPGLQTMSATLNIGDETKCINGVQMASYVQSINPTYTTIQSKTGINVDTGNDSVTGITITVPELIGMTVLSVSGMLYGNDGNYAISIAGYPSTVGTTLFLSSFDRLNGILCFASSPGFDNLVHIAAWVGNPTPAGYNGGIGNWTYCTLYLKVDYVYI